MRLVNIPWYASVPLMALTMGMIWWQGTQQKEYLAAPDEATLTRIRHETMDELKANASIAPEEPARAIRVKPKKLVLPDAETEARVPLKLEDFGDVTVSPALDCYHALATRGASVMSDVATQLEVRGEIQRALLAWERLVDSTDANSSQLEVARKAIQRLRGETPMWNVDPSASVPVFFHVSCDRLRGKALEPTLQQIVALMNQAGSGVFHLELKLQIGSKAALGSPPQPVAFWFSGTMNEAGMSKTVSIPLVDSPREVQQRLILLAVYKLVRESLLNQRDVRLPVDPQGQDPALLLESAVTRRAWDLWAQHFAPKKP